MRITVYLSLICVLCVSSFVSASAVGGMASDIRPVPAPTPAKKGPVFSSYKGVKIGMPSAESRKILGKASDESDEQEHFEISDKEYVDVYYDTDKTVKAISISYTDPAAAPLPKAVVGSDIEPRPNGSLFQMVRYPDAGIWVSYSKTAGEGSTVSVTISKL